MFGGMSICERAMNTYELHCIYQQWIQGNESYISHWEDFVALVALRCHYDYELVLETLNTCTWFCR